MNVSDELLKTPTNNAGKEIKKVQKRDTWSSRRTSFISILGSIIGLGNVWRFPYICYEYGGGAFLIPYTVFAVLCGFPLLFMEVALGQYTRQGAVGAWKVAPIMTGVGFGCSLISLYSCLYYITVMAWSLLYFAHSFSPRLPWMHCENWWNTDSCLPYDNLTAIETNQTSAYFSASSTKEVVLPIVEYWNNYILRKSSGLHEIGSLQNWPMVLCMIASWVMIYFCIFKGVRSTGKVVYFSATFPYFVLIILLIRSCTLDGAVDGIIYYLKPDISKLQDPSVWVQAGSQVCYSYAICFSCLIAFGSYNEFHMDVYKHTMVLVTSCSCTSFLAGFTVFGVLGNLAKVLQIDVANVVASGPGLAFVTYPIGLSSMPLPQLWNILFFLMLITLAIDSQFCCLEGLITIICDYNSRMEKKREVLSAVMCVVLCLSGMIFVTEGGVYVFELFNNYAVSGIALLWLAMMESIAVAWVYGADNFYDNINEMIGYYPSIYVKICLKYITPLLCSFIMMFYVVKFTPLTVMGYVYPPIANGVGWVLCLSSLLCVPCYAIYAVARQRGSLKKRIQAASASRFVKDSKEKLQSFQPISDEVTFA